MSSDTGVLNLFETSSDPYITDGVIVSDSEAERGAVHLANGEFLTEDDDHVYDNFAFSIRHETSQCDEEEENDVMWSVTQEQSSQEKSFLDPDSRDDSLENICAAISEDFAKPVSVNRKRKVTVEEKKEDASVTYCTVVCQDWLNEFNIAAEDLESSTVNVNDNFNEVRLDNFLRNKNPVHSFFHQNGGYDPMDLDNEEEFVHFNGEEDPFGMEEVHRSSKKSYVRTFDDEEDYSADDNSQTFNDYHQRDFATKTSRTLTNGDLTSFRRSKMNGNNFDEENNFDDFAQSTPLVSAKKKEIRLKRSNLIRSLMKQAKLNPSRPKEELSNFSFETPPSTPSDNDGQWMAAPTIEAFRPQGSGVGPVNRLRLGKDPGPPATVTCLNCSDVKPSVTLNNLAKHIEKVHCPDMLFCLLCKSDEKGYCPSFENVNSAFVHAMENHNTGDERYFICEFCQILFSASQHLQAHHYAQHPREILPESALKTQRRFPCLLCLFPFKNSGHRVDHYKNNHRMDVSVCFVRNDKKKMPGFSDSFRSSHCDESRVSVNGAVAKIPVNNVLKEAKLQMRALEREERRLKKMSRVENRQIKLERREEKQKRLAKREEEEKKLNGLSIIAEGNEDSNASSSLSSGVRRTALRADLKDRYSDILINQPRVVLLDMCDEYFKGRFGSLTKKFFERCINQPKIVLDPNPRFIPDPSPNVFPGPNAVIDPSPKTVLDPSLNVASVPKAVLGPSPNAILDPSLKAVIDPSPKAALDSRPKAALDLIPNAVIDSIPKAVVDPKAILVPILKAISNPRSESVSDAEF